MVYTVEVVDSGVKVESTPCEDDDIEVTSPDALDVGLTQPDDDVSPEGIEIMPPDEVEGSSSDALEVELASADEVVVGDTLLRVVDTCVVCVTGQIVVLRNIVSVVTLPVGQFVIVEWQDVIVYVLVV